MQKFSTIVGFFLCATLWGTHREMQFENEQLRVWKTTITPGDPLSMHRHDNDRIVVALEGGELIKIESTGEESELCFETGKAYWMAKDPEGTEHADINSSDKPIVVMVIEFLSP